jgi:hypothetical protein
MVVVVIVACEFMFYFICIALGRLTSQSLIVNGYSYGFVDSAMYSVCLIAIMLMIVRAVCWNACEHWVQLMEECVMSVVDYRKYEGQETLVLCNNVTFFWTDNKSMK